MCPKRNPRKQVVAEVQEKLVELNFDQVIIACLVLDQRYPTNLTWDSESWSWLNESGIEPDGAKDDYFDQRSWERFISHEKREYILNEGCKSPLLCKIAGLGIDRCDEVANLLEKEEIRLLEICGRGSINGDVAGLPKVGPSTYDTVANGTGYRMVASSLKVGDRFQTDEGEWAVVLNHISKGDARTFSSMRFIAVAADAI